MSRAEINAKFAQAYVKAPKADKGQILDQLVVVTTPLLFFRDFPAPPPAP